MFCSSFPKPTENQRPVRIRARFPHHELSNIFAYFFFSRSIVVKTYYHKLPKPQMENFIIDENMTFKDLVRQTTPFSVVPIGDEQSSSRFTMQSSSPPSSPPPPSSYSSTIQNVQDGLDRLTVYQNKMSMDILYQHKQLAHSQFLLNRLFDQVLDQGKQQYYVWISIIFLTGIVFIIFIFVILLYCSRCKWWNQTINTTAIGARHTFHVRSCHRNQQPYAFTPESSFRACAIMLSSSSFSRSNRCSNSWRTIWTSSSDRIVMFLIIRPLLV